ncbi:GNAT family N-acetyltransferase [Microbacterium sp. M3]|uniref:GNAT family N-acetyltransferase n=1 Tax=Microbacterium arthrosphaerae TaxID=792652 RepID=A0ABU4H1W8_9MICO|nr:MULTISPECIES: GNAT family N-acetyltransferase [Microbacterium]MDW4571894.1 GNAT family N-acetyltransferase [Microbacterium arthrosphaerae]MDW7605749.1 GNAT family N-acetyltransferase [Microbacterium sp. M3]
MELHPVRAQDVAALAEFLRRVDLTVSGLDAPTVRLWLVRDAVGAIIGSTGYELGAGGRDVLIRSVAVDPGIRSSGMGRRLARFAFDRASEEGARQAWLFSRRSGPFWQSLGFAPADRHALADALATTHQVQLFRQTGQLDREVAWFRPLSDDGRPRTLAAIR